MAAFVDYATRDRGVLGYRGFERALMKDKDIRNVIDIGNDIAYRILNTSLNLNKIRFSVAQKDFISVANMLGYSIKEFEQVVQQFRENIINIKQKHPQLLTKTLSNNSIINRLNVVNIDSQIINIIEKKYSNLRNQSTCPSGKYLNQVFHLDTAGFLMDSNDCYSNFAGDSYWDRVAIGLCLTGAVIANTTITWECTPYDSIGVSGKPRFGGLD